MKVRCVKSGEFITQSAFVKSVVKINVGEVHVLQCKDDKGYYIEVGEEGTLLFLNNSSFHTHFELLDKEGESKKLKYTVFYCHNTSEVNKFLNSGVKIKESLAFAERVGFIYEEI